MIKLKIFGPTYLTSVRPCLMNPFLVHDVVKSVCDEIYNKTKCYLVSDLIEECIFNEIEITGESIVRFLHEQGAWLVDYFYHDDVIKILNTIQGKLSLLHEELNNLWVSRNNIIPKKRIGDEIYLNLKEDIYSLNGAYKIIEINYLSGKYVVEHKNKLFQIPYEKDNILN